MLPEEINLILVLDLQRVDKWCEHWCGADIVSEDQIHDLARGRPARTQWALLLWALSGRHWENILLFIYDFIDKETDK